MSIKVMTWVWDNAEVAGADLLLLLAIADYCNEDGECYPSVKRLAKMARISESHAQTLLRKMKDAKDISVVLNAGIETGRGATNRYYVNGYRQALGLPFIDSTKTVRIPDELKKPKKSAWGIADNTRTDNSTPTDTTDNTSGVLPIIPKPSVEPSVEPIAAKSPRKKTDADLLARAYGIETPTKKDFILFGKLARELKESGIESTEYPLFIAWVKKQAASQGDWTVTPNSLASNARPSAYMAEKTKAQSPKLAAVADVIFQDTPVDPVKQGVITFTNYKRAE